MFSSYLVIAAVAFFVVIVAGVVLLRSGIFKSSTQLNWAKEEIRRADNYEEVTDIDDKYFKMCSKSALKLYKALLKDGHSGFSVMLTKALLDSLIDCLPLTPITEDDDWMHVHEDENTIMYQSTRMAALFKHVNKKDSTVKYVDNNRFILCDDEDSWQGGFIGKYMTDNYPIELPYKPYKSPIKVYVKEYVCKGYDGYDENDENNKYNFNTYHIIHFIKPGDIEPTTINKYFGKKDKDFVEITEEEFKQRLKSCVRGE